jgi:hypothetical protein
LDEENWKLNNECSISCTEAVTQVTQGTMNAIFLRDIDALDDLLTKAKQH